METLPASHPQLASQSYLPGQGLIDLTLIFPAILLLILYCTEIIRLMVAWFALVSRFQFGLRFAMIGVRQETRRCDSVQACLQDREGSYALAALTEDVALTFCTVKISTSTNTDAMMGSTCWR